MLMASLFILGLAQEPPPVRVEVNPGVVAGVVRGDHGGTRVVLPHAVVEWQGSGLRHTVAAGDGGYRLEGLPPGRGRLRVTRVGYDPLVVEVLVPPGGRITLDLDLRSSPVPLGAVHVFVDPGRRPTLGDSTGGAPRPDLGVAEASLRAAEAVSGIAEAGLGAAVGRVAPGSGDPANPENVLFMRGSAAEQKLVLLDGAPVYAPFHVGGLIQGFDPGTLGSAELHLGGAPARYDGGLAYVLDLQTRQPQRDRWQSTGALDLMSVRTSVEGPLGSRGGLLVGSRGLHGAQSSVLDAGPSPYGYGDALVRVDLEPFAGHTFRGTAFWNRESVRLDLPSSVPALASQVDPGALPDDASWGNRVAVASWTAVRGGRVAEVRGSWSRYDAQLPLRGDQPVLADGSTTRGRLSAGVAHSLGGWHVEYGASLDRVDMEFGALRLDPRAPTAYRENGRATTAGGFAEAHRSMGSEFHLRGGLRLDHFSPSGGLLVAPRAAFTWLPSSEVSLTLAAGRYHQQIRGEQAAIALASPEAVRAGGVPVDRAPLMGVLGASHVVVSLQNQVTSSVRFGLDGYVKWFAGDDAGAHDPLRSSGVDLRAYRDGERMRGWLGYSLSWYWSDETFATPSDPAVTEFTGRHLLTAGITGDLGSRAGAELRIAFGDGLPFTGVPVAQESPLSDPGWEGTLVSAGGNSSGRTLMGGPDDRFLRLDAHLHGVVTPSVGGRTLELRPYLKLLNALDRRDALFYYFEPWRTEGARPLAALSVLPVLGVEWRF